MTPIYTPSKSFEETVRRSVELYRAQGSVELMRAVEAANEEAKNWWNPLALRSAACKLIFA